MEWREIYNLGVEPIDSQHKRLVHMITRLQTASLCGDINQELAHSLHFLVDYTKEHFSEEERLMQQIGFDGLTRHQELHRKFGEEVASILLAIRKGKRIDPYQLLDFLTDWVNRHIGYEDVKIGRWIKEREGSKPAPSRLHQA